MNMVDGLAAVVTGVDDRAVALSQSLAARNLGRHPMQMADQGTVILGRMPNRGNVFARNNQHMHRCLRVDVGKDVALIVLVDGLGGDASVDDPAKKAAHD